MCMLCCADASGIVTIYLHIQVRMVLRKVASLASSVYIERNGIRRLVLDSNMYIPNSTPSMDANV